MHDQYVVEYQMLFIGWTIIEYFVHFKDISKPANSSCPWVEQYYSTISAFLQYCYNKSLVILHSYHLISMTIAAMKMVSYGASQYLPGMSDYVRWSLQLISEKLHPPLLLQPRLR